MANYVISATLELKDKLSAGIRSGVANVRRFAAECGSATKSTLGIQNAVSGAANAADRLRSAAAGAAAGMRETGKSAQDTASKVSHLRRMFDSLKGAADRGKATLRNLPNAPSDATSAPKPKNALGAVAGQVGGMMAGMVGVGAATAGINLFKQFDDTMLAVKAKTGATGAEFTALRDKAKELGATTRFSASEAAKGMDYLAMAGYQTNDIIAAMPGLLNLAAASGTDLATTSDIVSDAMTAFGWAAKDTEKFADIMAYASTKSNTNVSMMGEAFKYVASMSRTAGVSAQETAAALGMMANAGVKGSMAGTALRSSLIRLIKPPKEAADAMEELKISAVDMATGKFVGLRSIIAQFTEKTKGMTEAQKSSAAAAIFGTEAVSGMMGMINQGPEAFDAFLKGVNESKGASEQMAAVMNSGVGGAIANLQAALEGVVINLGDRLAPAISGTTGLLTSFATCINGCNFDTIIAAVSGLTAAFAAYQAVVSVKAAGGFVQMLAPAASVLLSLSGTALAAAAAVGALVAASVWLYQSWDTLGEQAGVWGVIGGDIKAVVSAIANEMKYVASVVDNELRYLGKLFDNELAYDGGLVANEFLYVRGVVLNELKYVYGIVKNELAYVSGVIKNEAEYWSGIIKNEWAYVKDSTSAALAFISGNITAFGDFLAEQRPVIEAVAIVLTTVFAPALIKTGLQAVIAGGKIAINFAAQLIATGKEAVVNAGLLVKNFVAAMVTTGKKAVVHGAEVAVSFVKSVVSAGREAVITAGKITGHLLLSTLRYAVAGWSTVTAIAAQTTAWLIQKGAIVATALAQGALTLAMGAWNVVCGITSAAIWTLGAAFAFLTSPIGLVALAIAGVVAAGIWMYNNWDAIKQWLILLWDDPLRAIEQFVESAKGVFSGIFDWLGEKWNWVKSLFFTPITANVRSGAVSGVDAAVAHNAVGSNYFSGGLTEINERGGEIIDLPRGSRIYPAATTQRMIQQELSSTSKTSSANISISGNTFVVREEADMDRIAEAFVRKIEIASLNFGGT